MAVRATELRGWLAIADRPLSDGARTVDRCRPREGGSERSEREPAAHKCCRGDDNDSDDRSRETCMVIAQILFLRGCW